MAFLTIDRPDRKNAFNQAMWEMLPELVADAMADPTARLLVLRSAVAGIFSAGADIAEFAVEARERDWRTRNQAAIRRAQYELARAPKPTVALIDGDCVGGGCGLAIACDLRFATSGSRFGITPARLGLVYSLHDTRLLVDLIGPAQAKRILFTGTLIDAGEAARIGLTEIVSDDIEGELARFAAAVMEASPHSVGAAKAIVRRILDGQTDDDEETLDLFQAAFNGADHRQRVAAFLDRKRGR